jgi:hypothetical protein
VPQIYTVIVLAVLGAALCAWQIRRAVLDTRADDRAAEARTQAGLVLDDHAPGINTGWQDQCELIWDLPAYSPYRERLKKRIASDPYYAATFRRIADDELAPYLADLAERLLNEIRDEQQKGETA